MLWLLREANCRLTIIFAPQTPPGDNELIWWWRCGPCCHSNIGSYDWDDIGITKIARGYGICWVFKKNLWAAKFIGHRTSQLGRRWRMYGHTLLRWHLKFCLVEPRPQCSKHVYLDNRDGVQWAVFDCKTSLKCLLSVRREFTVQDNEMRVSQKPTTFESVILIIFMQIFHGGKESGIGLCASSQVYGIFIGTFSKHGHATWALYKSLMNNTNAAVELRTAAECWFFWSFGVFGWYESTMLATERMSEQKRKYDAFTICAARRLLSGLTYLVLSSATA